MRLANDVEVANTRAKLAELEARLLRDKPLLRNSLTSTPDIPRAARKYFQFARGCPTMDPLGLIPPY